MGTDTTTTYQHDAVNVNAWYMHIIRVDFTSINNFLDFSNSNASSLGHVRVKILGSEVEAKVAAGISNGALDEGKVP